MSFIVTSIEQTYRTLTSTATAVQKIIIVNSEPKTFEFKILIALIIIIVIAALFCVMVCLACLYRFRFIWMPLRATPRRNQDENQDEKSKDIEKNEKQLVDKTTPADQQKVITRIDQAGGYNVQSVENSNLISKLLSFIIKHFNFIL